jgi:hypothetical protein
MSCEPSALESITPSAPHFLIAGGPMAGPQGGPKLTLFGFERADEREAAESEMKIKGPFAAATELMVLAEPSIDEWRGAMVFAGAQQVDTVCRGSRVLSTTLRRLPAGELRVESKETVGDVPANAEGWCNLEEIRSALAKVPCRRLDVFTLAPEGP